MKFPVVPRSVHNRMCDLAEEQALALDRLNEVWKEKDSRIAELEIEMEDLKNELVDIYMSHGKKVDEIESMRTSILLVLKNSLKS